LLFKHYPDIETAYDLICQFRAWNSKDHIIDKTIDKSGKTDAFKAIKNELIYWINLVESSDITELVNVKSLVKRNMGAILNYFYTGANAIAESNNSIIQHFIKINRGAKNHDFFYFRLSQFLA